MNKEKNNNYILYASIFTIIVILDQITKFLTRKYLSLGESIRITPFFNLTHVQNSGASFGILKDNNFVFIIIYLIVAILLVYLFYKEGDNENSKINKNKIDIIRKITTQKYNTQKIALMIFGAGLIGNLIDRLLFGQVTDFLDFIVWPVFNIADSALVVSVLIMCWMMLKKKE